jgi:nuclear transport factor 2 (NTF2) superfamily protein/pimeloyl-ACP methyl ester carboxylesterase
VDGLSIFYREAGPKDAQTILLLHGLPSSSRMFEPLLARLSDRYRLIAPDYPGFGHSDWPDPKVFAYTFDNYAEIMSRFTKALGLSKYTLYMQDYGGPVGFRMALAHPERTERLIVQDAVAHNEGLGANWKTRRAFWGDRTANEAALRTNLLSLEATRTRHVGDDPNIERYDPDLWHDEFRFLNHPGQIEIQSDLFYDYRTNVDCYPRWQAWMRERQPQLLVLWGRHDFSFDPGEPERYRKDVPCAQVHVLEAGHFALDIAADQIADLVHQFITTHTSARPPLPPFTRESAIQKVRLAEDTWNTRDPAKVAPAYSVDSLWRNRSEFVSGHSEIIAFLTRKWSKELDYRLIKELWAFTDNRIAVRFAYEWRDDSGHWFRSYGNENWEFNGDGLMVSRYASINDLPISEADRKYRWGAGRRPEDHPGLSELGL